MEFLSAIWANRFAAPHDEAAIHTCCGLGVTERRATSQAGSLANRVCHTAIVACQARKAFG